jgi:lysophospholipase L1-like esterase
MKRYERYVAIGDSTTEGLDDPDGRGGYRGWADRFAEHVARHQGGLLYANLAVRGRSTKAIRDTQLEAALALKPDLATVVVGMNDLIRPTMDLSAVVGTLDELQRALAGAGATVLTFTLPDLSPIVPLARVVRERTRRLNDAFREVAARNGARLLDLAAHPLTSDPRLWAPDRLHANPLGHERIGLGLAHALGIPVGNAWEAPLPPAPPRSWRALLEAEAHWVGEHLWPWVVRHVRGRSSGDGVTAKRPVLTPVAF